MIGFFWVGFGHGSKIMARSQPDALVGRVVSVFFRAGPIGSAGPRTGLLIPLEIVSYISYILPNDRTENNVS